MNKDDIQLQVTLLISPYMQAKLDKYCTMEKIEISQFLQELVEAHLDSISDDDEIYESDVITDDTLNNLLFY